VHWVLIVIMNYGGMHIPTEVGEYDTFQQCAAGVGEFAINPYFESFDCQERDGYRPTTDEEYHRHQ